MAEIDLSKSVLGFVPCIELRWFDQNQIRRYCRADADHTFPDHLGGPDVLYTAVPALDIEYQNQDGGTEYRPIFVIVPTDLDPFDKMITQTFAEVEITILEADFSAITDTPRVAFVGTVFKTRANYRGKSKLVKVDCVGRKQFWKDVSLGVKATDRCPWFFGDHVCGAVVAATMEEVESIDGTEIVLTALTNDTAGSGNGRYTRGYVEFEGLRIMVRSHDFGNKRLVMAKAPPQIEGYTWVGETVTIFEGCDKSIEACEFYGRQAFFGGIGRQMPSYNPLVSDRPEGG